MAVVFKEWYIFEKYTEEYAKNSFTTKENKVISKVDNYGVESLSQNERYLWQGINDRQKARKKGFLKGAEFIYNKMNDWNYHGIPHDYNKPYLCKVVHPTNREMTDLEILFYDEKRYDLV